LLTIGTLVLARQEGGRVTEEIGPKFYLKVNRQCEKENIIYCSKRRPLLLSQKPQAASCAYYDFHELLIIELKCELFFL
jgi:hypothetical protein